MPFKSAAQRGFFNANRAKLEGQGVNVDEWNSASKGLSLPASVSPQKKNSSGAFSTSHDFGGVMPSAHVSKVAQPDAGMGPGMSPATPTTRTGAAPKGLASLRAIFAKKRFGK